MKKLLIFMTITILSGMTINAQNELFLKKDFILKGDTLHYSVLFPQDYDKSKTYPLVIFLHGSGERGNDNQKQLIHGASLFTNPQNRTDYPAIVIFPQCPENQSWVTLEHKPDSKFKLIDTKVPAKPLALVKKLVDNYIKSEAVNPKKIYLIGLSMGGMGTFDLICRYPTMFAAAIPICGAINIERLKKVRKMPIRIYNGEIDTVVSPEYSRCAYIKLKALGSKWAEHIEFPGVGHDSWTPAFADTDFLKWLFSKSK
jgi:predicted peptidase